MKTRREHRKRPVPHDLDGDTYTVTQEYDVDVPALPPDWDHIVLAAVNVAAALTLVASLVWSTASVGGLLSIAVPAAIGYSVGSVFGLFWMTAMALEWLARYDPERAKFPQIAGHVALGIAMGAVGTHGYLIGGWPIAVIGAVVDAVAKTMWTMAMRHQAKPLDPLTLQAVRQRANAAAARKALAQINRGDARLSEELAAYAAHQAASRPPTYSVTREVPGRPARRQGGHGAPHESAVNPDDSLMNPQVTVDSRGVTQESPGITKSEAILAASSTLHPDATASDIARLLTEQGITVDPRYVRTVLLRAKKKRTGGPTLPDLGYDTGGYL